jgi:hypothetical protein
MSSDFLIALLLGILAAYTGVAVVMLLTAQRYERDWRRKFTRSEDERE